ncbi:glycosyltransferase [Candidatus Parcubacteria bacterium]|nr:glycosyltransferase [Candidatus Parcubacteria bacterium]
MNKNNKKKILFIAPQPFFEIRGTPIANKNMLEILSSEYEIDFLSYPIGENINIKNVNFFRSKFFGVKDIKIGFSLKKIILDFGLYLKTKELLKKKKYDVIHANEESILWASRLAKKYNIRFVYDMDSIISEQLKNKDNVFLAKIMKKIEANAVMQSNLILGISSNFENFCKRIKNNVNYVTIWDVPQITDKFKLENRFLSKLDNNKFKISYIGNNEYYQGTDIILELAKELPEYQFILAGVGIDSVENNVVRFSKVPMGQIFDLMSRVNLLISPRRNGTNPPMKIYTYMSSGKPIIASNIPAHNILINCGFLVDQDIDSYKCGIRKALSKKGKILAKKAKLKVYREFSFEKLKNLVLKKYGEI